MKKSPLVSIAVLSYKNTIYQKECLDSIFTQTYDNIELIISNDGADCFDRAGARLYAEANKTDNFSNIIINKNNHNMGTVRHCNIVLDLANGEYIMFIACDDTFNNNDVIKDMVDGFSLAPPDTMSIVGQTQMCNEDLTICMELYVKKETQRLINELTPKELYAKHLAYESVFPPASRIYKKEAFEKYGRFDEAYFLIEDWTSSISHAKQGMRTYYLDITCVNHRDGGVSHSASIKESHAHRMYALDLIKGYENVLLDESVPADVLSKVATRRNWWALIFCKTWASEYSLEMRESMRLGEYLASYWKALT